MQSVIQRNHQLIFEGVLLPHAKGDRSAAHRMQPTHFLELTTVGPLVPASVEEVHLLPKQKMSLLPVNRTLALLISHAFRFRLSLCMMVCPFRIALDAVDPFITRAAGRAIVFAPLLLAGRLRLLVSVLPLIDT